MLQFNKNNILSLKIYVLIFTCTLLLDLVINFLLYSQLDGVQLP